MKRIQQFTNAVRPFAATMTPGLRVVALLLIVMIVVSLSLLFQSGAATTQFLFDGRRFTDAELERIEVAFAKAKLSEHEIIGRSIRVPARLYSEYLTAFAEANVTDPKGGHRTDEFRKLGFFEPSRQKEIRMLLADEQDLALSIRTLPGIEDAKVRLNIRDDGALRRNVSASASVTVQCESADVLDADTAQTIRLIVAAYDDALVPEDVFVVDLNSKRRYPTGVAADVTANESDSIAHRQTVENFWQQKLARSLRSYDGANIVVNVAHEGEKTAAGAAEQLRVLVDVPTSYYLSAWQSKNQLSTGVRNGTPNADDLKVLREATERKIKCAIQGLCRSAVVTVSAFDDSLLSDRPESTHPWLGLLDWLTSSWPLIAGVGAICFFVWSVRLGLSSQSVDQTTSQGIHEASRAVDSATHEAAFTHPGTVNLRERLSAVVRSDPDAAAKVLQNWMKEAS